MKTIHITLLAIATLFVLNACNKNTYTSDASGAFEADEIIVSSETSGRIMKLTLEEGQELQAGDVIGIIDSLQLHLKKVQLQAQLQAILSKKPNTSLQLGALNEQLRAVIKEHTRFSNLVREGAAAQKQLDDINAQMEIIRKQLAAQASTLQQATEGIGKEALAIEMQIAQLNDQLAKCKIVNPVRGSVLTKFAETGEITTPGKALYKIADLSILFLRAYITSNQLAEVKLNQQVKIQTDDGNGGLKEDTGTLTWINSKAEFTPKTIQTKEERANMVYAVKIKVKNNGFYKIGMYGEVKFK